VIVFVERLAMGQKVSPLRPPCHLLHKEVEVGEAIGFICRVGEISRRPANVAALEPEAHPRALQRGGLTIQERRVLAHLAGGLSNPEIASALNLTRSTVKTYLQSALRKMGARNRVHALVRAAELGILDPGLARGRPAAPAVPPPHLKGSA
jgi:DNA-binding NarL/FixJ family response regulator